jgi:hypothetical protein
MKQSHVASDLRAIFDGGTVAGFSDSQLLERFTSRRPANPARVYQYDLAFTPGPEPTVTILDSEGNPLAGAIVSGIPSADVAHEASLNDHRIRRVFIHHLKRRLAGTLAVRDADPSPLVARPRRHRRLDRASRASRRGAHYRARRAEVTPRRARRRSMIDSNEHPSARTFGMLESSLAMPARSSRHPFVRRSPCRLI